jgi:flagellar hook-basal body complex protein FliE
MRCVARQKAKMDTKGIDQLLSQLNATAAMAGGNNAPTAEAGTANFADMLKSAVDDVNNSQQSADNLTHAFQLGQPEANLQDVMVSLQKASLSFQTMVQVRNKLVEAYQDVMNMQV